MNSNLKSNIKNLFLKPGTNSFFSKIEITDGRNSKIFLCENNQKKLVVKLYKNKNRLKREILFYKFLKINKIKSSKIDSELLLSKVLKKNREKILTSLNNKIDEKQINEYSYYLFRRKKKE